MRLLITGCARSGTMYLARLLSAAGISATHEATWRLTPGSPIYTDQAGDVEVSADAGLMLDDLAPRVEAVGHVVRHPQQVVASIAGRGLWQTEWATRHIREYPLIAEYEDERDRSLAYWVEHNRRIARLEGDPYYVRFPLDDCEHELRRLLRLARLPSMLQPALSLVPRTVNAGLPESYDWEQHAPGLRREAEEMIEAYGLAEAVPA